MENSDKLNDALVALIGPVLKEAINTAVAEIEQQRIEQSSDDIIGIDEACHVLGAAKSTVYIKCSKGELPHFKRGRLFFSRKALEEYIRTGNTKRYAGDKAEVHKV